MMQKYDKAKKDVEKQVQQFVKFLKEQKYFEKKKKKKEDEPQEPKNEEEQE